LEFETQQDRILAFTILADGDWDMNDAFQLLNVTNIRWKTLIVLGPYILLIICIDSRRFWHGFSHP
jgi:hypothetical protein